MIFLCSVPNRVGGHLDPSVPSRRGMHQRRYPRDRRGVPKGQRREGDGNRVCGQPGAAFTHDPGGQVAALRMCPSSLS